MAKYRKKPVIINAIKFTGNYQEVFNWVSQWHDKDEGPRMWAAYEDTELIIDTLEGEMRANIGDFIVRGVKGEFYPCKPDIFEQTYEKVIEGNHG